MFASLTITFRARWSCYFDKLCLLDLWDESNSGSDKGPSAEHIPEAEGLCGAHQRYARLGVWRWLCVWQLSESFVNICVVKGEATALFNDSEPGFVCVFQKHEHVLLVI